MTEKKTLSHAAVAEICRRRRLKRMDLLRKRKLGHYGWHQLKSNIILCRETQRNERRQKNTEQRRIARAIKVSNNVMILKLPTMLTVTKFVTQDMNNSIMM